MTRRIWPLGALVLVVAGAFWLLRPFFASQPTHPGGPAGMVGQAAPAFTLDDTAGRPVSLAGYHGQVVVMNLWASWCPPCRAEMPDLQRLATRYRGRGIAVVGVNEGESAQRASDFARALGIRFPIWLDERQQYGRVYAALGLPTTVIVGRDGLVVRGFDGPLTFGQMHDAVAGLVSAR